MKHLLITLLVVTATSMAAHAAKACVEFSYGDYSARFCRGR